METDERVDIHEAHGVRIVEGRPGQSCLTTIAETTLLIARCFEADTDLLLLYPHNLTPNFFDLSSREAGEILQKLQNYHIRLAVVCPPDSVQMSRRFGDLLAELHGGKDFQIFATRDAAWAWLSAG
jgi:hypothetical protein